MATTPIFVETVAALFCGHVPFVRSHNLGGTGWYDLVCSLEKGHGGWHSGSGNHWNEDGTYVTNGTVTW